MVIDIIERVTREEQLQKKVKVREVEQLKRVAQKLIGFRTQEIWMDKALSLTEEVADADMVVFYQTDKGGLSLAGVYPKGSVGCLKNLFPGERICGYAAKRERPVFLPIPSKTSNASSNPAGKGALSPS